MNSAAASGPSSSLKSKRSKGFSGSRKRDAASEGSNEGLVSNPDSDRARAFVLAPSSAPSRRCLMGCSCLPAAGSIGEGGGYSLQAAPPSASSMFSPLARSNAVV